ncbi:MAG: hypothetical protein ACPGYT_10585 [Nitrospirales bacterium]
MTSSSELSLRDSLKSEQRQRFYEQNKTIAIVMIVIVFLLPFVGVFVRGLLGAVGGVVISILAYYFVPYMVLMVRKR